MSLQNLNRFEFAPTTLDIQRSRFHVPHTHKTTYSSGELVPIGLFEVLPSDTFELDLSSVTRMVTPIVPTMDNSFLDVYAFFVPNRIACLHPKDWEKICGENVNGYWAPSSESTLELTGNMTTMSAMAKILPRSIGAYMGLPIMDQYNNSEYLFEKVSCLPLNGYRLIWNEWFRDQNTQPPVPLTNYGYQGNCLRVNKFHDYFTSCLPSPQKGAAVMVSLGDLCPVITVNSDGTEALSFVNADTDDYVGAGNVSTSTNGIGAATYLTVNGYPVKPKNLYADLSNSTGQTINQLRQAFAIQRMLEKDARGGSRYREILKTHYGSNIPDSTIQIPQYLGGKRVPLNITQVLQTSSTNEISPLGSTGAFSNSSFSDKLFTKSFDEHGFIHVVCCVRPNQTYSQGIAKMWTRNRRYDWYYPSFANLGEQPVFKKEIFYAYNTSSDNQVFGYQEAWAEYRYIPNRVSGFLAPKANDLTLTAWTYTNNFSAAPTLTADFMQQNSDQVGNTLVIEDANYQFISDFYFDMSITRAMPTYSIPGLIDHH